MPEYIRKDAVIKRIADVQDKATTGVEDVAYYRAIKIIRETPAEEVQPVEHSRWIPMGDGTYNAFCENCGMERGSKAWNKDDFKYCFCCGA